jgi:3-hydroxyacyl-[acyl-carrier-protein] dehydratase
LAEEHLHDLYPAFPIVPHSLIVEGMAQTAGILVGEARNFEEKVILAKIGRRPSTGWSDPAKPSPSPRGFSN